MDPNERRDRPPPARMPLTVADRGLRWVLSALVRGYRLGVSPLLGPRCRHLPTCSAYALEAIEVHGACKGAWLACKRFLRCHPLGTAGYDPVPPRR